LGVSIANIRKKVYSCLNGSGRTAKGERKMTNPFMAVIDWIDENADFGAPIGAFIGVAIAVALCFIFGA